MKRSYPSIPSTLIRTGLTRLLEIGNLAIGLLIGIEILWIPMAQACDDFEGVAAPELSQAHRDLVRRLIEYPQELDTNRHLSLLEIGSGQPGRAIQWLLQIPEDSLEIPSTKKTLARAYFQKAMKDRLEATTHPQAIEFAFRDAADLFNSLRSLGDENGALALEEARCHLELGNTQEASRLADEALQIKGQNPGASFVLGLCHLYQYQQQRIEDQSPDELESLFDDADKRFQEALKGPSIQFEATRSRGDLRLWSGAYSAAADFYQSALVIRPQDHQTYASLKEATYLAQGGIDYANILRLAIHNMNGLDQIGDAIPLLYLGEALLDSRDLEEAEEVFRKIQETRPSLAPMAQLFQSLASHGANDYERAGEILVVMARKGRGFLGSITRRFGVQKRIIPMLRYHSNRMVDAGRVADARDLMIELVDLSDEDAQLLNNVAYLCRETKQYEDSLSYYIRALSKDPENPRLLNDTSVILHYYLARDLERAKSMYEKAIANSQAWLANSETRPPDRALAQSALKDAKENLHKLETLLSEKS